MARAALAFRPCRAALAAVAALALGACAPTPPKDAAAVESVGILARHAGQAEAVQQLQDWARQGHAVAQRELGLLQLRDSAQTPQGLEWLGRAALGGDGEAGFVLGEAHRQGQFGLRADPVTAKPWLTLAARAGHADGALALARLARNGEAGPRDAAEAAHWLRVASERGNAHAMLLLSYAYAQGDGIEQDLAQARHWMEQSADRHFSPAIQAYALALENGDMGFEKKPDEARELLQEAREERRNRWNSR